MKHKLALALFIATLSVAPLVAGDAAPKSTRVQQKLREIDLNIMLKQYESVQTQLAEIKLKVALLAVDEGLTDAERNGKIHALEKKAEILQEFAHSYHARAADLDANERSSAEAVAK